MSRRMLSFVFLLVFLPLAATARGGQESGLGETLVSALRSYIQVKDSSGAQNNKDLQSAAANLIKQFGAAVQKKFTGDKSGFVGIIGKIPPEYGGTFADIVLAILQAMHDDTSSTFTKNILTQVMGNIRNSQDPVATIISTFNTLVNDSLFDSFLAKLTSDSLVNKILNLDAATLSALLNLIPSDQLSHLLDESLSDDERQALLAMLDDFILALNALGYGEVLTLSINENETVGINSNASRYITLTHNNHGVTISATYKSLTSLEVRPGTNIFHYGCAACRELSNNNPYIIEKALTSQSSNVFPGTRIPGLQANQTFQTDSGNTVHLYKDGFSSDDYPFANQTRELKNSFYAADSFNAFASGKLLVNGADVGTFSLVANLGLTENNAKLGRMSITEMSSMNALATGGSGTLNGKQFSLSGFQGTGGPGDQPIDAANTYLNQSNFEIYQNGYSLVGGDVAPRK